MLLKRNLVDKCKETIMVLYKSGQTSFGILHSSLESIFGKGQNVDRWQVLRTHPAR